MEWKPTLYVREKRAKIALGNSIYNIIQSTLYVMSTVLKTTRYQSYTWRAWLESTPTLWMTYENRQTYQFLAAPMDENTSDAKKINTEK